MGSGQVIQVISSGKFFSAEEVDVKLTSASSQKQRNTPRFRILLETVKTFFYKCSTNVLIWGEMNPLHKHKVMSVGYQVK